MAQYIPKSALVAEIERRLEEFYKLLPDASKVENGMITISEACNTGKYTALESFKDYVDTLKVKEVDLEEEMDKEWNKCEPIDEGMGLEIASIVNEQFDNIAKHFFELGLNASNPLTWEDTRLIAEIGDKFMNSEESDNLSEEEYYTEILNRFKAQKGE